jgi:membrane protein YdbS with pleckstrin-like domain
MAAAPPHRRSQSPVAAIARVVREAFWVIALGVIACYAFFVALGAWHPGDVVGVSIAVGVLVALWIVHGWAQSHRRAEGRDPRLTAARERRGF